MVLNEDYIKNCTKNYRYDYPRLIFVLICALIESWIWFSLFSLCVMNTQNFALSKDCKDTKNHSKLSFIIFKLLD